MVEEGGHPVKLELWAQLKPRAVIVIDNDPGTRSRVHDMMSRISNLVLDEFTDGEKGWQACLATGSPYDLVLIGWKVPNVAGPALLNRLRQHKAYASVPILVISDLIKRKDFRLLEEFPCTQLVEKPVTEARLAKTIEDVIFERDWNQQNSDEIRKLFAEARSSPKALATSMKRVLNGAPNPGPIGLLIAEALIAHNFLEQAVHLYKLLLTKDGNNLRAMNGLGRVLYRLGRPDEAAAHLRIAWRECQLNIARLCMLGELDIGNLDVDSARRHFANALSIDQEDSRAKAGIELCTTLNDHIQHNAGAALPRSFASICNTLAVSLVRAGDFTKGIDQYKAALQLLSEPYTGAQVMFNLGMAYVRWSKPLEAKPWFEAAVKQGGPRFLKAQRYLSMVLNSEIGNTALAVAQPDIEEEITLLEGKPFEKAVELKVARVTAQAPATAVDESLESWFAEEKF